jgi:hypothetical protein
MQGLINTIKHSVHLLLRDFGHACARTGLPSASVCACGGRLVAHLHQCGDSAAYVQHRSRTGVHVVLNRRPHAHTLALGGAQHAVISVLLQS